MSCRMIVATIGYKQPDGSYIAEDIWSDKPCTFSRKALYEISSIMRQYINSPEITEAAQENKEVEK